MRFNAVVVLVPLLAIGAQSLAAPMELKCSTTEGGPLWDPMVLDIEKHTMSFATPDNLYTIVSITNRYITSVQSKSDQVGAEVFVLDRTSGEYWRSYAALGWTGPEILEATRPPIHVTQGTYHGRCARPI